MRVWLRRIGMGLGVLVVLLLLALAGVYGLSAAAVGTGHAGQPLPF